MNNQSLPKATIVLAEDHPGLRDGIAELLFWDSKKYDIEVHKAENGRVALDIMQTVTPDLIISDLMMPEMDGEQFFTTVRNKLEWRDIPFILLKPASHHTTIGERHFIKPFDDDHLVESVEDLLDDYFSKRDGVKG